jgi:hypothetical protein
MRERFLQLAQQPRDSSVALQITVGERGLITPRRAENAVQRLGTMTRADRRSMPFSAVLATCSGSIGRRSGAGNAV